MGAFSRCPGSGDDSGEEEMWVVLETESEFCVVADTAIDCDEDYGVGDKVKFRWSRQRILEGIIRFFNCKYSGISLCSLCVDRLCVCVVHAQCCCKELGRTWSRIGLGYVWGTVLNNFLALV